MAMYLLFGCRYHLKPTTDALHIIGYNSFCFMPMFVCAVVFHSIRISHTVYSERHLKYMLFVCFCHWRYIFLLRQQKLKPNLSSSSSFCSSFYLFAFDSACCIAVFGTYFAYCTTLASAAITVIILIVLCAVLN